MKNLKKLVSVVLALALVISTFATSAFAVSYADVETTDSNFEAIDILSGLGILKGDEVGNFNPDAEIKRSEVAAVIARALGQESAANGTTGYSSFADVSADHWAVGYINWAAQQGIVNGRDANTFDPDAPVKYQEVIKMIVAALGYEPLAQKRGGYPTGYMVIASSNAITAGISLAGDANAPRKIVAQAVYNALDVPLMDASLITASGDDEYAIYNGKGDNERRTVLSYYLEIAKVKAQVIATTKGAVNYVDIDTEKMTTDRDNDNAIEIKKGDEEEAELYINTLVGFGSLDNNGYFNGYEYYEGDYNPDEKVTAYCGGTSAPSLLGYHVIAYVGKDDNDDDRIFAITPDQKKTEILEVKDWIETVTKNGDIYDVEYYEDGDSSNDAEEIEVSKDASVIVNGSSAGTLDNLDSDYTWVNATAATILTEASDVVLMRNANEDEYTTIFVTKYEYDKVVEVDVENESIDTENGIVALDEDAGAGDFRYTIYLDGAEIELADVQENDVLNMVYQKFGNAHDSAFVDIYVSRDVVEGVVSEKTGSAAEGWEFVIDGTEYETFDGDDSLSLGDEGTFYLTIDGKIFDMIVTSASKDYAFIVDVESEKEFGVDTWYVKMVTADGTVADYTVAANLKVSVFDDQDNNRKLTATYKRSSGTLLQSAIFADIAAAVAPQATAADVEALIPDRFVTYTLNANSEITGLTFAVAGKDSKASVFDMIVADASSYNANTGKFGGYVFTDETKLFAAPASAIVGGTDAGKFIVDEDDVEIASFASLDEDEKYDAFIFNTNANKEFGAAVVTTNIAASGILNAMAVVTGTSEGTNAAGDDASGYTIVQSGEVKVVYEGDDVTYTDSDIAKGDIIYFTVDGAGDLKKVTKVFDADTRKLLAGYDSVKEIGFAFGLISDNKSSYIELAKSFDADGEAIGAKDYDWANNENGTYALVEDAKKTTKSYVSILSGKGSFKATAGKKTYMAVLRIDDNDEVVDAVAYLYDEKFASKYEAGIKLDYKSSAPAPTAAPVETTPAPSADVSPAPSADASPVPSADASAEPSADASPAPTADPSADPAAPAPAPEAPVVDVVVE